MYTAKFPAHAQRLRIRLEVVHVVNGVVVSGAHVAIDAGNGIVASRGRQYSAPIIASVNETELVMHGVTLGPKGGGQLKLRCSARATQRAVRGSSYALLTRALDLVHKAAHAESHQRVHSHAASHVRFAPHCARRDEQVIYSCSAVERVQGRTFGGGA